MKVLREFWADHRDVEAALRAWVHEVKAAEWQRPQDVLDRFGSADILSGNRVVFNIKGNQYRLIVQIHYNKGVVYVRFVGTHAEYDRVDAENI